MNLSTSVDIVTLLLFTGSIQSVLWGYVVYIPSREAIPHMKVPILQLVSA